MAAHTTSPATPDRAVVTTRTVALLAALDTKAADAEFLRRRLEARGLRVLLVDLGVLEDPPIPPDVPAEHTAGAGGSSLADLRSRADRSYAVEVMTRGAREVVPQLVAEGRADGILALGGGAGTTIGSAAMQALPLGVPKVILSTVAAGDTSGYLGTSDIVMFPSLVDVAGVNRVSRITYTRAADTMVGMLGGLDTAPGNGDREGPDDAPLIAASMFGVTTPCVQRAQELLEQAGCEVIVFHATGVGGRTMERLVGERFFDAVLDLTTTEWADEVVGGILSAGPTRLSAAGAAALPQVVSVGATDMVNFGRPESVGPAFAGRTFYQHNAENTLMRTNEAEAASIGHAIGDRLDEARGETVLLLPRRGVSMLDAAGQPFDDPQARDALTTALLRRLAGGRVRVEQLDAHINDPVFAERAAAALLELLTRTPANPIRQGIR